MGPCWGLAGRRNRSEPLFGSAQPNCRGWVGFLGGVRVSKINMETLKEDFRELRDKDARAKSQLLKAKAEPIYVQKGEDPA